MEGSVYRPAAEPSEVAKRWLESAELSRQFRLVQNERFRSRLQFTLSESIRPLDCSDLLTASLSRAGTREHGLRDAEFYGN